MDEVQTAQQKLLAIRRERQIAETVTPIRSILPSMSEVSQAVEITRTGRPCRVLTRPFDESCYYHAGHYEACIECQSAHVTNLENRRRAKALAEQQRIEEERAYLQDRKDHPEKWLPELGIPKKHLSSSFESFQGGESVKRLCKEAVKNQSSLFISGQTGCGKTHLATSMLRAMVQEAKELPAKFVSAPELLLKIRHSFRNDGESETDIIDEYSSVPILVLDDLGAEKATEWSESTLYLIIDRRNRDEKQTIVTTNLSLDEVQAQLGARIASRLSDMRVIKLNLPDYRKKRAAA